MTTGRVNVGGGSGGATLNVYAQLNEPAKKEGIWIQTTDKIKEINMQKQVYQANGYAPELGFVMSSVEKARNAVAIVGDIMYCVDAITTDGKLRAYNLITRTWSIIGALPQINGLWNGHMIAVDNVLYLYTYWSSSTNTYLYKYDITTNTWTLVGNNVGGVDSSSNPLFIHRYGDFLYLMRTISTNAASITKFSLLDNTFSAFTTMGTYNGPIFCGYANRLFSFGEQSYIFECNIDTVVKRNIVVPMGIDPYGKAVNVGDDIYIFGGLNKNRLQIYNVTNNTCVAGPSMVENRYDFGITYNENYIYLVGGIKVSSSTRTSNVEVYSFEDKQFNDNELVFLVADSLIGNYWTQIFSSKLPIKNKRLLFYFYNAWIFKNLELQEYPSYYGDGTQWIKFKN